MNNVKTTPVDEHLLDMVGHCCGARFTALPTLDDGIDFTPTSAVKAEMETLQKKAQSLPPTSGR